MSILSIFPGDKPDQGVMIRETKAIKARLANIGVRYECWPVESSLAADADQETVLLAYQDAVASLKAEYDFQHVDVIGLQPDHPEKDVLRNKFLSEHTHDDFEVRFFVAGRGLFYLHTQDQVFAVLCEQGDLLSVPAQTRHWFDMGENPEFKCIRFFTTADCWQANFTGSDIAEIFPDFDQYVSAL